MTGWTGTVMRDETMGLRGKIVVVTGAAGGIGRAVAIEMASQGAAVVLSDVRAEPLERTVRELLERGLEVHGSVADITTPAGNQQLIANALERFDRIDVFHANAGIAPFEDLLQATAESIERTIDVNLKGAIHGCAAVLPTMVAQHSGVILLTASVAAFVGDPTVPVYGATKGGLTALCKSVAVRHGPDGIRCNSICPGDVRTQMLEDYLALSADPAAARRQMIERYPLRRLAEPEDIARLAAFLASDAAGWITGTDVVIDGGLTARCY
jgi:NAD(P)-dependent dehydrogenase (short-subunit alcohol dehydrogenase family)